MKIEVLEVMQCPGYEDTDIVIKDVSTWLVDINVMDLNCTIVSNVDIDSSLQVRTKQL